MTVENITFVGMGFPIEGPHILWMENEPLPEPLSDDPEEDRRLRAARSLDARLEYYRLVKRQHRKNYPSPAQRALGLLCRIAARLQRPW
jgi:hypothetical protein